MYQVILFTNRNLIVFDRFGQQDTYLQNAVDCYGIDRPVLDQLLSKSCQYFIAKWGEWKHQISQKEFEYLLGQRTREKDLADLSEAREE